MNIGKPAKQFDIVEVIESPYQNDCKIGERFVALDVFNGDDTVISMRPDGTLVSLCFPEDYVVIGNVDEFNKERKEKYFNKL